MRKYKRRIDKAKTDRMKNAIRDLYHRFEALTDWRKQRVGIYPIAYLLICIVICLLIGDNNVKQFESTLSANIGKVKVWLGSWNFVGIPSDTTLLRALHHADSLELMGVVSEWSMKWFGEDRCYAIDGKAVRAALRKVCGRTRSPYILNCFARFGGYVVAQVKIKDKSNEIGVVRDLFRMMPMEGAFITTDAFATNACVIKEALGLGAHCLMPIKENQPKLFAKVSAFVEDIQANHPESITWYEDEDNGQKNHGRLEFRKTGVITKGVAEVIKGTPFEGIIAGLAVVSRDREVVRHGEAENLKSNQTLIYLFTKEGMTAEQVSIAARGHWAGCEMVHYCLDTEFDEDLSTLRTGYGMENLSALRKCAYSLLCDLKEKAEKIGSFHAIRMILRDLGFVPEETDEDYRRRVNRQFHEEDKRRRTADARHGAEKTRHRTKDGDARAS